MVRLQAHFDGTQIVLDEPVPNNLRPETPVEVLIPGERELALREWREFSHEFWSRPLPPGYRTTGRTWKRDDLYEQHSRDLS